MFKIGCLFLLLFCATSCINGGADDTPQDKKPPVKDDQKQYKENLLDFSGVPMTQYLAENNDLGVNIVNINLNKASAKVLADNVNKGVYKVNVKLLAGQDNVSGRQLKTPDCTFDINSNKSSCQISFFKFANPGVYTLSFSYDGIEQTKQIFLYVADRQLEFKDDAEAEIHKKATEYNVGLILHTDLSSDKLSVPLSVTDGLCVIDTGSNGSSLHPAGSPCLDSPVCEYESKSDTTSKVCFITYTVRDTINKNSQNIGIYLPKADIKDLQAKPYFPKVCGITGIELYNDDSEPNKEPLSALDMHSKENPTKSFQVLFCDARQDKTADSEVTITKANTQPISGFESAILINDQSTNPIKETIQNGKFSVLSLKYSDKDDVKKNIDKFAGMDINFDGKGAQDIISKKLVITNPGVIAFLKMAETADDLNQNNSFDSPIADIHLHAHQESVKNVFIKGFNISSDKNDLYLQQCLHLEGNNKTVEQYYRNCGYDYEYMGNSGMTTGHSTSTDCTFNKPEQTNICITQFDNQEPNAEWATVKVTDFPLTINMSKYDDPDAISSDISPVVFNDENQSGAATKPLKKDVPIMKGVKYHLELSAKQIPQLSGAFLELNFGYKDSTFVDKTLFSSGKLLVKIEPQEYQYFPKKIRTIAVPEEAESVEHIDKFFVTVRPGVGGDMAPHKLKLVLADQNIVGPDKKTITLKNFHVYHMVADDIEKDGYVTLGDNSKDPKNECTITDTKPTASSTVDKGCWCYYPKASTSNDANSCNFEIRASGKTGDSVRVKFVNYATGNPVVIDGTMGADFQSFGKSMMFAVRDTGAFKLDDSKFRVSFPDSSQVLVAKTTLASDPKIKDYPEAVFNADSFFYGEGYSIVNSADRDNFVITNFPGKNTWQNSGSIDVPRIKLYTGDGTVCDIPSAFKMSNVDGENNDNHNVMCRETCYSTEQDSTWDGCGDRSNHVHEVASTPWLKSDDYRAHWSAPSTSECRDQNDNFRECVGSDSNFYGLWWVNYQRWSKGKHRHVVCNVNGTDKDFMLSQSSDLTKSYKICLSTKADFKTDGANSKPEELCKGKLTK